MRYLLRREGDPVSGWCEDHGVFRTSLRRIRFSLPMFDGYGSYRGNRVLAGVCPECQTMDPICSRDNVRVLPLQSIPRVQLSESGFAGRSREKADTALRIRTWSPAIDALDLACYAEQPGDLFFARETVFTDELRRLSDIAEDTTLAERIVDLITFNIVDSDSKMLMLLMLDDDERAMLSEMADRVGLEVSEMAAGICLSALLRVNESELGR